ncbi:uncharacterized protein TA21485 [Theileria annulata]|uniref:Uncharacterized protein n=1 Tax=Theileria annulata TaxID=5874 RepID=Q4UGL0_THEAN|nr:uncharacterized protein TA21485 [Theileria annulata]CAI73779.1 hypothetical protein, conserved [Theileria annulata]|eukprot:XP_954456.1 hypothetical protein, conserved [Theileria annulata]
MNISTIISKNCSFNRTLMFNVCQPSMIYLSNTISPVNPIKTQNLIEIGGLNNNHASNPRNTLKKIETPITSHPIGLPEYLNNIKYKNPLINNSILTYIEDRVQEYINDHTQEQYLFNKLRNDTKNRKRAFVKRGYFRRTRSLNRKLNRLSYAYALQGIDYEMVENLAMGEIPDLKDYFK